MNPLDPQTKDQLIQEIGIRYSTTAPTHTPDKETEVWIVLTGGTHYIYAYSGGWKRVAIT